MRGLFITFEGPDGSGKSTQARLLLARLRRARVPALLTREPGGSKAADALRAVLLDPGLGRLCPETELLLFAASRAQHVKDTILPALRSGKVVLCDRFADSTVAYQAFGRGFERAWVDQLNAFAAGGLTPDLTLLFDLSEAEGLRRAAASKGGRDRMEKAGAAFHRRVRQGFLALAKAETRRVRRLAVQGLGPDAVFERVLAELRPLLKRRGHAV
jgi:dTMP kinase